MTRGRKLCSGRAWVKATTPYRRHHAALQSPCALCREPIDYTLHHNHKRAFTVDHIHPLWAGGPELDPANWQPAHRSCNSTRGAPAGNRKRRKPPSAPRHTSARW